MKQYFWLAVLLVIAFVVSGCSLTKFGAQPSGQSQAVSEMGKALASDKPVKCVTKTDVAGVQSESTMYADLPTKRVRSITTVKIAGKVQTVNALKLDEMVYSWNEGASEGVYIDLKQSLEQAKNMPKGQVPATNVEAQQLAQVDPAKLAEQVNTTCEDWKLDESLLVVPKDIKFVDQMAKIKELTDKAQAAIEAAKTMMR